MRRITAQTLSTSDIQKVLGEFSERMPEFGIVESDVISVSVFPSTYRPPNPGQGGLTLTNPPKYEVIITHWSDE